MSFFWTCTSNDMAVGSGWAKSVPDAHSKASASIALVPADQWPEGEIMTTVIVHPRAVDDE